MHRPSNDELQAWIDRIATGESAALLELINALGPWLHGVILRMVEDKIAAAVLLEESFAEIWTNAPLYDDYAGTPWTWMLTVARSRGMEWRDKRRVKGKVPDLPGVAALEGSLLASLDAADAELLSRVFHDGLPGGDSGAADRGRFDQALLRYADGLDS